MVRKDKTERDRLIAIALSCTLLISAFALTPLFSAEENKTCPNHPAHDASCGYVETVEGHACNHEHTDACYLTTRICEKEEHAHDKSCYGLTCTAEVHTHAPECYDAENNLICGKEAHAHGDACYTITCGKEGHAHTEACYASTLACQHVHDESCGYREAAAGAPCTHTCALCDPATKIETAALAFSKDMTSAAYADVVLPFTLHSDALLSVRYNSGALLAADKPLRSEADAAAYNAENAKAISGGSLDAKAAEYVASDGFVTLHKEYLSTLAEGSAAFKLIFKSNTELSYTLNISPAASASPATLPAAVQAIIDAIDALPGLEEVKPMEKESDEYKKVYAAVSAITADIEDYTDALNETEYTQFETSVGTERMTKLSDIMNALTPGGAPEVLENPPLGAPVPKGTPPVLTPTNKIALINETAGTTAYYATLKDAMTAVGANTAEYMIVFTQAYTVTGQYDTANTDLYALANNGANAAKLTFTSTYNNGTSNVTSNVTLTAASYIATLPTATEFKDISFINPSTNIIYAQGHKLTMGQGVVCSGTLMQIRNNRLAAYTGDSDITVLSGTYQYVFGGGDKPMTGNAKVHVGGSAVVTSLYGGTAAGTFAGNTEVTVDGAATVTNVYGGNYANAALTGDTSVSLDGAGGAKAMYVFACGLNTASTVSGSANIAIKDMKNIVSVNATTRLTAAATGKVTIEGDSQIQNYLYAKNGVTISANAALQLGSNAGESTAGTAASYQGVLTLPATTGTLRFGANSQLIFAGNGAKNVGNIAVDGAGASMAVFKTGSTTTPLNVYAGGAVSGGNTLALGVHENPNAATTALTNGDKALTFATAANALHTDYSSAAAGWIAIKDNADITFCRVLDDPIDISKGIVVFTSEGAIQYVGQTATIYARDLSLKSSYTITGTATYTTPRVVYVQPNLTLRLTFDDLHITNGNTSSNASICVDTSHSDVTITLKGSNSLRAIGNSQCNNKQSGGIVKNGMDASLVLRCQYVGQAGHICSAATCGSLDVKGEGGHVAGIGSSFPIAGDVHHGFANVNIKGGVITSKAGTHTPGIGLMCGLNYYYNGVRTVETPESYYGEIFHNVNITGGRVYAYGGDCCAGIGSGWGGKVDGISISNGAYVYAEGGDNSPGIGSGGNYNGGPAAIIAPFNWHVSNIVIAGGGTVVEAVGGASHVAGYPYTPGIGVGLSNYVANPTGTLTNVQAQPEAGYLALVKQGTSTDPSAATYIAGSPSETDIDILADQFYTLVYFSGIEKTASVNGAADAKGTASAKIPVNAGSTVKYTIDVGSMVESGGRTGTITDKIPAGMTLSTAAGSYTPGMTHATVGGVTTVSWVNQTLSAANHAFFFTVTVDALPTGVIARDYVNTATLDIQDGGQTISIPSNSTYHHCDLDPGIVFTKTDAAGNALAGAGFTVYQCTNTAGGHTHASDCTWDTSSPFKAEKFSDGGGQVGFTGFELDSYSVITETTVPSGYVYPSEGSYILAHVAADGTYTLTGFGNFAASLSVLPGSTVYRVKNRKTAIEFTKTNADGTNPLAGAGFTLYECTNAAGGHVHGTGCTWNAGSQVGAEQTSGASGSVLFQGVAEAGKTYILVETTTPTGYKEPEAGSYIVVAVSNTGGVTMTGVGDFADAGAISQSGGRYSVENEYSMAKISVKKVVSNYTADLAGQPFFLSLTGDIDGELTLAHNETSKVLTLNPAGGATFDVSEALPMEYALANIGIANSGVGTAPTLTLTRDADNNIIGAEITVYPGNDVLITVTNTFGHKGFFKARDWIVNRFD